MNETLKFKNCPNCKKLLSQDDYPRFCPSCGQDLIAAAKDLESILARIPPTVAISKQSFPWYWLVPIGLIVFVAVIALASNQNTASDFTLPVYGSTLTPAPVFTSVPRATQTSFFARLVNGTLEAYHPGDSLSSPCIRWNQVTVGMNGQTVCVYGIIKSLNGTRYKFSDSPNTFFLYSVYEIQSTVTGKTLAPGECVRLTDTIRIEQDVPYMNVDDLLQNRLYQNFQSSDNLADCP